MTRTRCLVAMALLMFAVQARAFTVDDIYDYVTDIWDIVTGDVKSTSADLKQQLDLAKSKGTTVREAVQDGMEYVQQRRGAFLAFVDGHGARCGEGSPCMNFRLDLENFVLDMAELKTRFPQVEKQGLGDGGNLAEVIDRLPPVVLFGLHQTLDKVPGWQQMPQNLADLHDEVDDPDAFSDEPLDGAIASKIAGERYLAADVRSRPAAPQASFGVPGTRLDFFCSAGKRLGTDPVRFNRVRATWTWMSKLLDGSSELVPEAMMVVVAGEGTEVPNPLKGIMKLTASVIESIFASVDAYRANLELCSKIESDVAACTPLKEYRTKAGVLKTYWTVIGVMHANDESPDAAVDAALDEAGRAFSKARYQDAYRKVCDAYAQM